MRYKVTFLVTNEQSGYATYLAKISHGNSPPYQTTVSENMARQFFTFDSLKNVNSFLKKISKEIGFKDFILECIEKE